MYKIKKIKSSVLFVLLAALTVLFCGCANENEIEGTPSAVPVSSVVAITCRFTAEQTEAVDRISNGSATVYKIEGSKIYLLTNVHVLYTVSLSQKEVRTNDIKVKPYGYADEDSVPATFIADFAKYDIAMICIESEKFSEILSPVVFASSYGLYPGEEVYAVGNAAGRGISASKGIVSLPVENISFSYMNGLLKFDVREIRCDALLSEGDSGGGLFDRQGNLIGIINAKINTDDKINMGYAIPSETVSAIAEKFMKKSESTLDFGITTDERDNSVIYDNNKIPKITADITIASVKNGSLASTFLKPDDVVIKASCKDDFLDIERDYMLKDFLLRREVGDSFSLTVRRKNETIILSFSVTEHNMIQTEFRNQ